MGLLERLWDDVKKKIEETLKVKVRWNHSVRVPVEVTVIVIDGILHPSYS